MADYITYGDMFRQGQAAAAPLAEALEKRRRDRIANELMQQSGMGTTGGGAYEFQMRDALEQRAIQRDRARVADAAAEVRAKAELQRALESRARGQRQDTMYQARTRAMEAAKKAQQPQKPAAVDATTAARYKAELGAYNKRRETLQGQVDELQGSFGVDPALLGEFDPGAMYRTDDLGVRADTGTHFVAPLNDTTKGEVRGTWDNWAKYSAAKKALAELKEPTAPVAATAPPAAAVNGATITLPAGFRGRPGQVLKDGQGRRMIVNGNGTGTLLN